MITSDFAGPYLDAYAAALKAAINESVVDKVLPDMLPYIHPHWYQFPPMSSWAYKLVGLFMFLSGIISFVGNGLVVYIFSTTKALRTPANLLIINLSFSEFCMMNIMAPVMITGALRESWVFGPLGCQLYGVHGSMFGNTSIWTMTMIARDRYEVIVKGMSAKPMTIKSALIKILIIWLHGIVWTVLPLFGWNRYVPEGNLTACGTDYLTTDWFSRSYILIYSIFMYYTPLLTIIISYYFIVKTVYEHEKNMREQAKKMNVTSLRSNKDGNDVSAEFKLAKVALSTISLWFLAWTPYLIINYAGVFEMFTLTPSITVWGAVFAKANAVYNPIVYAMGHPKYQVALKEKFPCFSCRSSDEASTAQSTTTTKTDD